MAITTLAQRIERIRSQRSGVQDEVAEVRTKVGQLKGEISWLVIAEKNSARELELSQAERADLKQKKPGCTKRPRLPKRAPRSSLQGITGIRARRERFRWWPTPLGEVAALEGEKRSLGAIAESNQRTTERLKGQVEVRQTNSRQLENEAAGIGRRLEENRASLAAARERLTGVEKESAPGREDVIHLDQADCDHQEEAWNRVAALLML